MIPYHVLGFMAGVLLGVCFAMGRHLMQTLKALRIARNDAQAAWEGQEYWKEQAREAVKRCNDLYTACDQYEKMLQHGKAHSDN